MAPNSPLADDTISAARATSVPFCNGSEPSERILPTFEVPRADGELGVAFASDGDVTGSDGRDFGGGVTWSGVP